MEKLMQIQDIWLKSLKSSTLHPSVFLRFSLKSIRKNPWWSLLASLPITRPASASASSSRDAESSNKNVWLETRGESGKKASYRRTRAECLMKQWRPLHSWYSHGVVVWHLLKCINDGKTTAPRYKHSEILFLEISLCALYQIGDAAVSLVEMHIKPRILCFLKAFEMANHTLRAAGLRDLESSYGAFVARGTENEKTNSVIFPSTWTSKSFVRKNFVLLFLLFFSK